MCVILKYGQYLTNNQIIVGIIIFPNIKSFTKQSEQAMNQILFLPIVVMLTFSANQALAQELAGKKNTFITFDLLMSNDVLDKIDPYTPTTTREKENARDAKKYLEQVLLDKLHEMVRKRLMDQSIEMQPMDALEEYKVVYNNYGYPNTLIAKSVVKKAQKNGYESDHFLVVKSNISVAMDIVGKEKLLRQVKPTIKISCITLDDTGKRVGSAEAKFKFDQPIKATSFPSAKFDKLESSYMDELISMLEPGLLSAVDKTFGDTK